MELLILLVQRRGELVSREEIAECLWGKDAFHDIDHGINTAIRKVRLALRDDPEKPRFVETVTGRGYRFAAPVICSNGDSNPQAQALPSPVQVASGPTFLPKEERVARVENGAPPAVEEHLAPVSPLGLAPELWNKRRLVVTAGVTAFLFVSALATWRIFFTRPVLTETDVILLASFVNKTGDPIFDNSLDKALEVKLTESPFLSLFPEADVRRTMGTMRHDPTERVTQELGIEICKRQGLKAMVVPEIAALGSRYLITLEAIDARNQKSIALTEAEAETKDKVIAALGKAGSQLRRRLGESLGSLERFDAPLDLATTSSLEALQAYRTGQTLYRSGKQRESIPFFERAVELDPQFCSAYGMLGSAYHSIDDGQASRRNFARAFELKDRRLTQEENFKTTAFYHSAITGNLEKEAAVLVLYKQAYPRSAFAHNLLGIVYAQLGRIDDALQEFYWAIDDSPVPSAQHYGNASQVLVILGRFEEAKKLLEQWRQKGAPTSLQIRVRYRIALFENDVPTMERLTRETSANDTMWLDSQKMFAFYRGEFSKLRSLSETLVKLQSEAKRMDNVASELAWHAWFESYAGNSALVRKLCRQAEEASQDSAWLAPCALALAHAGDVPKAEALAERNDRLRPEDTLNQKTNLPLLRSIIERRQGNAAKAVELLAPLSPYEENCWQIPYHRAKAYLAAGENDKAAAELEKLLGHRGWLNREMFAPLAELDLARAYAVQGDREESRKAYDDFFTTWKDADPDLPILRQAKAEYKKLTATASAAASASGRTVGKITAAVVGRQLIEGRTMARAQRRVRDPVLNRGLVHGDSYQ
jgi:DNA-binding winged helix-turn-helix (wHTH) protein/tetratricopeptide (TPR) repeat protein